VQLDPATLLVVSAATTFLVGTLFMASWRQAPESRVLAYWGAAHLVGAAGSAGRIRRSWRPWTTDWTPSRARPRRRSGAPP